MTRYTECFSHFAISMFETTWVDSLDVARDPFAWSTRAIGAWRCVGDGAVGRGAGVDEQAGAIGKDEKRRVTASGTDVVDVEMTFAPGSQYLKEQKSRGRELQLD